MVGSAVLMTIERLRLLLWLGCVPFLVCSSSNADDMGALLTDAAAQAHVKTFCVDCHRVGKIRGEIRLDGPLDQVKEADWHKIVQVLHHADMPPEKTPQPSKEIRQQLEGWAQGHLNRHILKRAGDPGAVVFRRLTAIELDNMIRDLTGHAMQASRHFPTENFGGEGFSNLGNVQSALSGPVLDKYLAMAEDVAKHARFAPDGTLAFDAPGAIRAPEIRQDQALFDIKLLGRKACGELYKGPGQLIGGDTDERLLDGAYKKAAGDWKGPANYLACLWLAQAGKDPSTALDQIAKEQGVNRVYLHYLWQLKSTCPPGSLEEMLWVAPLRRLPAPKSIDQPIPDEVRAVCQSAALAVWNCVRTAAPNGGPPVRVSPGQLTYSLIPGPPDAKGKKAAPVAAPGTRLAIVVELDERQREKATVFLGLPMLTFKEPGKNGPDQQKDKKGAKAPLETMRTVTLDKAAIVVLPDGAKWAEHAFESAEKGPALELTRSGTIVIDIAKAVSESNPAANNLSAIVPVDRGAAGGLVRFQVVLNPTKGAENAGLDSLWLVANKEQVASLLKERIALFERWFPPHPLTIAPFDKRSFFGLPDEVQFFRDDQRMKQQLFDDADRRRMDDLWSYLYMLSHEPRLRLDIFCSKQKIADLDDAAQLAALAGRTSRDLNHPYGDIPRTLAARLKFYREEMTRHRTLWRQRTLSATLDFATRAWRRPLSDAEKSRFEKQLDALQLAADKDAEDVLRTMLMRVLVSPHFLYRCERMAADGKEVPLDAWELATRLSLFVWASLPDDELRRCAADGSLLRDDVLRKQTRRMLTDPKARGMAEHFFGQWLGFAGFDRGESDPDKAFFPDFTPAIRKSLHQEAVAFFEDLIRQDRDVRSIVGATYSFIDETLRGYYGLNEGAVPMTSEKKQNPNEVAASSLHQKTDVKAAGRGGVLGMGAILVKNSRTRRTSPVNRGLWVVENLLGQHLPPPPANVPPIPDAAEADQGKSLRQQMILHRENAACATCHVRIDPFGFAFEAFDAAGRRRTAEVRKAIEYETTRDGVLLDGIEALKNYLDKRSDLVQRNLIRRMLGYALNRPVAVSDFPLVDRALDELPKNEYRLSSIAEQIVLSRQFRSHRAATERDFVDTKQ